MRRGVDPPCSRVRGKRVLPLAAHGDSRCWFRWSFWRSRGRWRRRRPRRVAKPRPPKERRLHVASAEASSYLINDWNKFQENYLPLYVGDDDPRTAWSLKTEGIGEWLRVHVTPMEGATKLRMKIRNGYQKTPRLWEANSRAKELTVTLLPSKKTVDVTLEDKSDWQEIAVEQPAGALEAVELKVKSVYAGKKYDDLCISDVQLFVTATSTDNPAFEKQRLEKIATWKKERVAAAKMFKTKLGQSLPIAPQYVVSHLEGRGRRPAGPAPTAHARSIGLSLDVARPRARREGPARESTPPPWRRPRPRATASSPP